MATLIVLYDGADKAEAAELRALAPNADFNIEGVGNACALLMSSNNTTQEALAAARKVVRKGKLFWVTVEDREVHTWPNE